MRDAIPRGRETILAQAPIPGTPSRRRRRRLGARGRWLFGGLAAAVVVGGAAIMLSSLGGLAGIAGRLVVSPPQASGKTPAGAAISYRQTDPVTVLIMGTEVAPTYAAPQLTDSMMLVAYDPRTKTASALSVPRDLWIDVPGFGYQRINTAYENTGVAGAELAVEKYFGVPVDYYAIVNYTSLTRLVDAVGGVTVHVPHAIYDPCFPNAAENRCTVLRIPQGVQHMDGAEALAYARERHDVPGEDLGRQADQQALLLALKHALLKPQNLFRLPAIISAISGTVESNLPPGQLLQLAEEALRLPRPAIRTAVLSYSSGEITNYTTAGGAMVLLPNSAAIQREAHRVFAGVLAPLRGTVVQVEDGAPTTQPLATYFSVVLQGMGVSTLAPETAARTDYRDNHVYVNTAVTRQAPALAYILSEMLGCQVQREAIPASSAPVVVILGAVFPNVSP